MTAYIIRRLIHMLPVLFVISLFTFLLIRAVPGNPASAMLGPRASKERVEALNRSFGLDRPVFVQYGLFMKNLAQGDMGDSIRKKQPVTVLIRDRLSPTLFLTFYSMLLALVVTVPMATWAALNKGKWQDQVVRVFVLVSLPLPAYWVAMMLLQYFSVKHKVFPVSGYGEGFFGHLESLFLPAVSLALAISSLLVRCLRTSILETLESDYVRTARAKGLSGRTIFTWHVLRNSALSSVTLFGIILAFLVGGTTITETIFAIPGLGKLIVESITQRDYPVIQGVTLTIGVIVLVINLLTDLSYAVLDPRVKLA
jgi:peptide/nickel transport system permease protein